MKIVQVINTRLKGLKERIGFWRRKQQQVSVPDVQEHTELITAAAANATAVQGLTVNQVKQRLSLGQWNLQSQSNIISAKEIIHRNVFSLFNILNFALALLVLIAAFKKLSYITNVFFMGVVISNIVIGLTQELKAKKILESLAILVSPMVQVKREGQFSQIPSEHVVIDDLLLLESGQQIAVDGVVRQNQHLEVDESLLTGESEPVLKQVGDPVYAGSLVVGGSALIQACLVGPQTLANKIAEAAREVKQEKSELRLAIGSIIKVISFVILPVGLLLFIRGFYSSADMAQVLVSTVAALIGMIPEGLVLLTEIAFAVSTVTLAQNKTLVQRMSAIEMLARTDVLCLDKTGTITSGRMKVMDLKVLRSHRPGQVQPELQTDDTAPMLAAAAIVETAAHKSAPVSKTSAVSTAVAGSDMVAPRCDKEFVDADKRQAEKADKRANSATADNEKEQEDNYVLRADSSNYDEEQELLAQIIAELLATVPNKGLTHEALIEAFAPARNIDLAQTLGSVRETVNFSSARKWFGVNFTNAGSYMLGAADFILRKQGMDAALAEQIAYFSQKGQRLLLLAHSLENFKDGETPEHVVPLALLLIEDEIRIDAQETFYYFREQGVELKIISGDNPVTVAAIAKRAGFSDWRRYIDMSSVDDTSDYRVLVERYSLFGRVNPYQKQKLLLALQANGHVVTMTGDGVNDVPAMKKADCAVAMAAGSDATRKAADLVLMNNNLSALIAAVYEGRRVINNIELVATLFLSKTVYSCLLSVLYIFLPGQFPLYPIQISLISTLTIGIPAFFLALKPNRQRVQGSFLQKVMYKAIPTGVLVIILSLLIELMAWFWQMPYGDKSTLAVLAIEVVGFALLYKVAKPLTILRYLLLLSLISVFFICIIFLPQIFFMQNLLSPLALLALPLVALAGLLFKVMLEYTPLCVSYVQRLMRYCRLLFKRFGGKI